MRIRKNARLITSSSSSSSFLVCQLNRSPWDVDSSSLQGEVEEEYIGVSRNFAQVIPSSDSLPSVESIELSFEYVENKLPSPPPPPQIPPLEMEIEGKLNVNEDKPVGCRNNDKNSSGWKHIQPPLPPVPAPPKKRGRPKKSASIAATSTATAAATATTGTTTTTTTTTNHSNGNPYEFYYYSGFGPSWSKRRGNKYNTSASVNGNNVSNYCNRATINDVDDSPSSSASHAMCEDDRNDDDKKKSNVIVLDRVVEGELDYIEDDFDDDDDDDENGGRRIRKPVKARSLKSLM